MFNSLTGRITFREGEQLGLQAGAVEWLMTVPVDRDGAESPAPGGEYRFLTHLHHKEDQMALYGFWTVSQRRLFFELLKVSGIGPKQAVKILSHISTREFLKLLEAGSDSGLARIPGLGKKTAQKILLALKGKFDFEEAAEESKHKSDDIVNSLMEMGFDRKSVETALKSVTGDGALTDLSKEEWEQTVFRQALIELSSRRV